MNSFTSPHTRHAIINKSAFISNVSRALTDDDRIDLSANAFGHGTSNIVELGLAAGHPRFSVSHQSELDRLQTQFPDLDICLKEIDELVVSRSFGFNSSESDFLPVLTLQAEVLAVKDISRGDGVSYGYTWRAPHDGWLALVALGYADGFNRAWGNRVNAHLSSARYPAVGRVAMDAHSIWTAEYPLEPGDIATYLGATSSDMIFASDLAATIGCSHLAVTANLSNRIVREVV